MERTYSIHFTVKGVSVVTIDDSDYDTLCPETVAEDIFLDRSDECIMADLDTSTVEIDRTIEER